MKWQLSHRRDRRALVLADQHYSRQKPGTPQFMPAGRTFNLFAETETGTAVWGTSWPLPEFTKHEWAGAWICSIFRNEGAGKASALIRQAVAATRYYWGDAPALGMVTFVDVAKIRAKANPGHSFIIAGFRPVGFTKRRGYLALQLLPDKMPDPAPAAGMQTGFPGI